MKKVVRNLKCGHKVSVPQQVSTALIVRCPVCDQLYMQNTLIWK